MSTNKSQNLKLHLWEPEDDFLRAEFNENFAALDSAVKAEQKAREQAVKTEQEAREQAIETDRASISAVQALASQAFADANLTRYAFGGYLGDGRSGTDRPNILEFGFKPSFLLIVSSDKGIDYPIMVYMNTWPYHIQDHLYFTPTETGISWYSIIGAGRQMSQSSCRYFYLALR